MAVCAAWSLTPENDASSRTNDMATDWDVALRLRLRLRLEAVSATAPP